MLFKGHASSKASFLLDMRAGGHVVLVVEFLDSLVFEILTAFEATKGKPLPIGIKPVGPGQQPAGSERPALLIIPPVQKCLFGEFFVSGIVIDDGPPARRAYGSERMDPLPRI